MICIQTRGVSFAPEWQSGRYQHEGESERDHFPGEAGKWKVINCGDKRMRREGIGLWRIPSLRSRGWREMITKA